ncbi:BEM_HP_G0099670.mRNA.1.CDS.1 [Saccharomyces cerevisiae]|nr:BEM_HP_G0099670.mRNA.1.CDS.1 [Saccharomyces cerevisiae]CAI7007004.1 BEM_HP_G0099670.mRNA.1.CDS.1 [Saccharomyces cerevisiae]
MTWNSILIIARSELRKFQTFIFSVFDTSYESFPCNNVQWRSLFEGLIFQDITREIDTLTKNP